jgi:hypothetical protein
MLGFALRTQDLRYRLLPKPPTRKIPYIDACQQTEGVIRPEVID